MPSSDTLALVILLPSRNYPSTCPKLKDSTQCQCQCQCRLDPFPHSCITPSILNPLRTPLRTVPYKMTQQPPDGLPSSPAIIAARVAASKTSSTPSPVNEEHSRYFRAPMISFISLPSLVPTKRWLRLRISSMATGSERKSFFNPTRMMGMPGHCSRASSAHLALTFSKLSGESTL